MTNAYVVTGLLTNGRTVTLDEPLPKDGRVRVVVEVVETTVRKPILEVMEQIWESQRRRGHVPRSAEEIQDQIREERESWGD